MQIGVDVLEVLFVELLDVRPLMDVERVVNLHGAALVANCSAVEENIIDGQFASRQAKLGVFRSKGLGVFGGLNVGFRQVEPAFLLAIFGLDNMFVRAYLITCEWCKDHRSSRLCIIQLH